MIAVVPDEPMVSYARNHEDVVLWRALGGTAAGRYVEVGAPGPGPGSATRALYDHGWAGTVVLATAEAAREHRTARPRDTVLVPDDADLASALAQATAEGPPVDVLVVGPGGGTDALSGVDLRASRPSVVLVPSPQGPDGAPRPGSSPTLLDAGYLLCLHDGANDVYVAAEHEDRLRPALSYPACTRDGFVDHRVQQAEAERDAAAHEADHWRRVALTGWAEELENAAAGDWGGGDTAHLRRELDAIQQTLSWRITRPLRGAKGVLARLRSR